MPLVARASCPSLRPALARRQCHLAAEVSQWLLVTRRAAHYTGTFRGVS